MCGEMVYKDGALGRTRTVTLTNIVLSDAGLPDSPTRAFGGTGGSRTHNSEDRKV